MRNIPLLTSLPMLVYQPILIQSMPLSLTKSSSFNRNPLITKIFNFTKALMIKNAENLLAMTVTRHCRIYTSGAMKSIIGTQKSIMENEYRFYGVYI